MSHYEKIPQGSGPLYGPDASEGIEIAGLRDVDTNKTNTSWLPISVAINAPR